MAIEKLAARLTKGELIILDGGMGTEIKRRGLATGSGDLAVHGMVREPDKLREIHENFIEAGADVILTNTYLCNAGSLSRTGVDSNRVAELNSLACDIARKARERSSSSRDVFIAGAMGPVGKPYDPDGVPDYETCLSAYRQQVQALAKGKIDFILVETSSKVHQAKAGVEVAAEAGFHVWAALVADSQGRVKSGEPLDEAEQVLEEAGASALLINCTPAVDVTLALKELGHSHQLPMGAYAQAATYQGQGWDFEASMSPQEYLSYAREWVGAGARIVGGCCGTTPEHIGALKAGLGREKLVEAE